MAALVLDAVWIWLAAGAGVAVVFVLWGVGTVVPNARGAWAFRPLIVPGVVLVWPLVLWRWRVAVRGADEGAGLPPRRAQDRIALGLAVAIPLMLTFAVIVRQNGPLEREAVLLVAPEVLP